MSSKWRNLFLSIGIIAIVVMVLTFDMQWEELLKNLKRAGYWFPLIMLLWVGIYLLNTLSWYIIIHDDKQNKVPFWKLYKYSISGFALNYATPVGLMGGGPYRIMELTPYLGAKKATSKVILYVMTHIFSHFWFWLLSIPLFLILYPVDAAMGSFLIAAAIFCSLAIYFFLKGYKNGMAERTLKLCQKIPFIKKWAIRFSQEKAESIHEIDQQIAELNNQHRGTFIGALLLELLARITNCLEIWIILGILAPNISFFDCLLIQSFTSLFANFFFFSPMQLGAREGGFALVMGQLALRSSLGIYLGLIVRVRELCWIAIGITLMRFGNKISKEKKEESLITEDIK